MQDFFLDIVNIIYEEYYFPKIEEGSINSWKY